MKQILIVMVMVVPVGAIANTCPAVAPTGCSCPAGVIAVRAGGCNASEITVVQGNCSGCNFAAGAGNLTFGI